MTGGWLGGEVGQVTGGGGWGGEVGQVTGGGPLCVGARWGGQWGVRWDR